MPTAWDCKFERKEGSTSIIFMSTTGDIIDQTEDDSTGLVIIHGLGLHVIRFQGLSVH